MHGPVPHALRHRSLPKDVAPGVDSYKATASAFNSSE